MSKVKQVLAIASGKQSAAELTAGAALLGEQVSLIYLGKDIAQAAADSVIALDLDNVSITSCVPALLKMIGDLQPDIVLTDCSRDGRYVAAQTAVMFGTAAVTDASTVELCDDGVHTSRLVYGGKGIKKELRSGRAVVCVSSGTFDAATSKPMKAAEIATLPADGRVTLVSRSSSEVQDIDISAAKRIIGVGRGLKEEGNLRYIERLAESLNAEIACTRPVAEEMKWYPRERYIGVSGITVKPEVYIAVGISGQIQHTIGVTGAKTIIAINRDKDAPMFSQCDIGIVGDAVDSLEALLAGLGRVGE